MNGISGEAPTKTQVMRQRGKAYGKYDKHGNKYESCRAAKRVWAKTNREKCRAHLQVCRAVAKGIIEKTPCEICRNLEVQGHHHRGYDHPLDVQWLCHVHHRQVHPGYRPVLTHCWRGHPFDEANTYRWNGRRYCRACGRIRDGNRRTRLQERQVI